MQATNAGARRPGYEATTHIHAHTHVHTHTHTTHTHTHTHTQTHAHSHTPYTCTHSSQVLCAFVSGTDATITSMFSTDQATGVIILQPSLDYETTRQYKFDVEA